MQKKYATPANFILLLNKIHNCSISLMLLVLFFLGFKGYGQVSSYSFVNTPGMTYTAISGTAVTVSSADDGYYNGIPIGFTFNFNGTNYTHVHVSTNGWMTLGTSATNNLISSSSATNNIATGSTRPILAPLWDDLSLSSTTGIRYLQSGTSPNRKLTIQYNNLYWNYYATGTGIEFQVILSETSNTVQFIYNRLSGNTYDPSASIGIGGSSGDFLSLDVVGNAAVASSTTETTSISNKPTQGRMYTFSPPPVISSLGSTNACAGSSITINGRNLAGATAVSVGGTPVASITSNTATTIVAVLGAGTTGHVTVTTANGTGTSPTPFTVNPIPTDISIASTASPAGSTPCTFNYMRLEASGGIHNNAVAFSESFSGSPIWAVSGTADVYGYVANYNDAGGVSPEAGLERNNNGSGDWWIFPATSSFDYRAIDITNFTSLSLSFRHYYNYRGNATHSRLISVDISTNKTTWASVWNLIPTANINATAVSGINLSSYVGNSTIYIRFRYSGQSAGMNYWSFDDIKISGNKENITWSPTTGLYTDASLSTPYTGTNSKVVFANPSSTTTYIASTNLSGCSKSNTVIVQNDRKLFTGAISPDWNVAGNWSPSGVPTIDNCVTIPANATVNADGNSKTVTVTSAGNINVNSGNSITIKDALTVQTGGIFTLENNASLVQEGLTNTNTGSINVKRTAKPMKRYDFTYWSSPVSPQTLFNLSPSTLPDKYYSWNPDSQSWLIHYNGSANMVSGKGYIVRAPQSFPIDVVSSTDFVGTFTGVPNSGDVTIDVKGNASSVPADYKWNLIGNPYPSAIKIDEFLTDSFNSSKINGTIYLWTHNSPPSNAIPGDATYNYTANDYAAYNGVGGTATSAATPDPLHPVINPSPNTNVPNGFVASGQSFFIRGRADATVKFTNDMREKHDNNQFFRTSNAIQNSNEKSRFWINLRNNQGAFHQTLVGYLDGASNEIDNNFDGELFGGNFASIYSLNSNTNLTIQGRALPFEVSDVVPLGINTTIAGTFSISLDNFDGLFASQNIFLKDKLLNIVHDLKSGGYEFTTLVGTVNDRFEIIYQNTTLGINNPTADTNQIIVYKKHNDVVVNAGKLNLDSIKIFDIQGKLIHIEKNINDSQSIIKNLPDVNQVLIVQIRTDDGIVTSRKIIF